MTITPEQKAALERAGGAPVRLEDPETQLQYYLIRADLYAELLEEQRVRSAIASKARRNAAGRMQEP